MICQQPFRRFLYVFRFNQIRLLLLFDPLHLFGQQFAVLADRLGKCARRAAPPVSVRPTYGSGLHIGHGLYGVKGCR